jgi:hypothetical protein
MRAHFYRLGIILILLLASLVRCMPAAEAQQRPQAETVLNLLMFDEAEYKQVVDKFERCTGKRVTLRDEMNGQRIQLARKQPSVHWTCAYITWAEAYLIGLTEKAPPPGHEGDSYLVCTCSVSSAGR